MVTGVGFERALRWFGPRLSWGWRVRVHRLPKTMDRNIVLPYIFSVLGPLEAAALFRLRRQVEEAAWLGIFHHP